MACYQRMVNEDFVQHRREQEFRSKVQQITANVFTRLKVIILRGSDIQKGYWSAMNCTCKFLQTEGNRTH
jgi:hypothetical protein